MVEFTDLLSVRVKIGLGLITLNVWLWLTWNVHGFQTIPYYEAQSQIELSERAVFQLQLQLGCWHECYLEDGIWEHINSELSELCLWSVSKKDKFAQPAKVCDVKYSMFQVIFVKENNWIYVWKG